MVVPRCAFLVGRCKSDREQYQPREEGTLSIPARDANGKPVSAAKRWDCRRFSQIHSAGLPAIRASSTRPKRSKGRDAKHFRTENLIACSGSHQGATVDIKEVGNAVTSR